MPFYSFECGRSAAQSIILLFLRTGSFSYDTPFTASGKSHGATTEQFKRRTVIKVANPFPSFVKRQAVIERCAFLAVICVALESSLLSSRFSLTLFCPD